MGFIPPNDDPRPIAPPAAAAVISAHGWDIAADTGFPGLDLRVDALVSWNWQIGDIANKRFGADAGQAAANVTVYRDGTPLTWGVDVTWSSDTQITVTAVMVTGEEYRVDTPYTA